MFTRSFKVVKIAGIELRLDPSWFIILALVSWSFAAGLFPLLYPGLGRLGSILAGLVAALLFFASVVAHEFSHSLYAKSQGLKLHRITLFIFGGASELEEEPHSPRQEVIMAGLGPLSSLVLGVGFGLIALAGAGLGWLWVKAVGEVLATTNVFLGVFNLLPGFPLDGGRILRAVIWHFNHQRLRATQIASFGGQILGAALIGLGFLQLVSGNPVGGIWFGLIGFFLIQAARASYIDTLIRTKLDHKLVRDFMTPDFGPITEPSFFEQIPAEQPQPANLRPTDDAMTALRLALRRGQGSLPVMDSGRLVGYFTVDTVRRYLSLKT